jgi:hypothetical protein
LSRYVLRTPNEPFWKDFPVDALRILKQNFLDGKRAEGAIDGHEQIPSKCGHCGLHFIVLTWFPDRHDGTSFYCPECGEQFVGEMGRRNVLWEIGQACVQAGAKPIGFKQMCRNRKRGIPGAGRPIPIEGTVARVHTKYLAFAFEEDDGRSWSFEVAEGNSPQAIADEASKRMEGTCPDYIWLIRNDDPCPMVVERLVGGTHFEE